MNGTNDLQKGALANLPGVGIYCLDVKFHYTAFTNSHKDFVKAVWGGEMAVGANMLACISREEDRNKARENFERTLGGETFVLEEEYRDGSGGVSCWWENRYAPIYSGGRVSGLTVLGIDITARKKEEARMRHLALVMDKISGAVISTDRDMRITHWNKSAEILYGWLESEALGRSIDEICRTEFMDGQQEIAFQTLLVEKSWRGELKQHHRTGAEIWVDAAVTLLEDGHGKPIGGVTINHDVTDRKLAEDEMRRTNESIEQINLTLRRAFEREQLASRTDSLTGAFNRRYFFELLEYEFAASRRYQRPLSLVMFDVDFLKKINDTFGHLAGDEILKKAAREVRVELRDSDVLARYGGDEFVILLSNSDEQDASIVLNRIYERVKNAYVALGGQKIAVSISAGIAGIQPEMDQPDQLVSQADRALYIAKHLGRNRLFIFNGEAGQK